VTSIGSGAFSYCSNLEDVYCYADTVPSIGTDAFKDTFKDTYVNNATLHVPDASVDAYKAAEQWKEFGTFVGLSGNQPSTQPTTQKCATPTIAYQNGKIVYDCTTDGVDFVSEVTAADCKKYYDAEVSLTATYSISVFATKTGYNNSDTVTATLVWLTAVDDNVTGIAQMQIKSTPLLISMQSGLVSIAGLQSGTTVNVLTTSGAQIASATATENGATVDLSAYTNKFVIIRVGTRSAKVMIR